MTITELTAVERKTDLSKISVPIEERCEECTEGLMANGSLCASCLGRGYTRARITLRELAALLAATLGESP